jgi:RNA dependent RNA polymerase
MLKATIWVEQHSIAVDFAKTGIPASVPENTKWNGARAHWREKPDEPFYHCNKVLGQLYDDVIKVRKPENVKDFSKPLAGRQMDRYGNILAVIKKGSRPCLQGIFKEEIPEKLGWDFGSSQVSIRQHRMQYFTKKQHYLYEEHVIQLMNKYNLRSEGELFTGCIGKYHRLHKMRQFEISEDLRRQCRELCDVFRKVFFVEVLSIIDELGTQQLQVDSLHIQDSPVESEDRFNFDEGTIKEAMVSATETCKVENRNSTKWKVQKVARELAAAYYIETYSPDREFQNEFALFSFPWLVADVIAACVQEHDLDDNDSEHSGVLDI